MDCPASPNLYVKVLTPVSQAVSVLGDRVFKRVIQLKQDHQGGP